MVSVIIPTRNRAGLLRDCLLSLTTQTLSTERFEVIVVDNGSRDDTREVIGRFMDRLDVTACFEARPGLHEGRHHGMRKARSDILVFADDDIEATPGWLSAVAEVFENPGVAMAGGNNLPRFLEPPPAWLASLWNRSRYERGKALGALSVLELPGPQRPLSPDYVWGCNFSIRKQVLAQAGGFHPDAMPPDMIRFRGDGESHVSNFVTRAGLGCEFHPSATVYHKVPPGRMSFEYFRKRGFNQGVSDSYTALRGQDEQSGAPAPKGLVARVRRKLNVMTLFNPGVRRALMELQEGHREGFEFHQHAYRSDPEVRDWVHKDRYF